MNKTLALGMIEVLRVHVDSSENTLWKNEKLATKEAGFSRRYYGTDLETFKVSGRLSGELLNLLTEDEIEDLVSKEASSNDPSSEGSSIRDLMDSMPLYSTIMVEFRRALGKNAVEEYRLALNRRGCAGKELEEFRVTSFDLVAYEYETE